MTARNDKAAEVPPHSLEAEQAVIGSILLDPILLDSISQRLRPDDFHAAHCRRTYAELLAMRAEGVPIDGLILRDRLQGNDEANIVRASDLAEIVDSVPTAAHAMHYADIVARRTEQRRLWYLAPRVHELARDHHRVTGDYHAWRRDVDELLAPPASGATGDVDHGWMSFSDFMAQDARIEYLCDGVVPAAQGGIISGRFKTLKTSIAIDLFISMATGTAFLERFACAAPIPCALMTSESGAASIMAIAKRIAAAKGIDHRDGPHLTTERARMTDDRHLERLERDIERHGWRCVGIDPTYLAFADVGEFCTNVYKMGAALEPVTALIQRTGCSLILLNHSTKIRGKDVKRYDPPDLAEISMSGWAEWMRFWLLLSQAEEWDEPSGTHCLWLKVGGSVGHGSLHSLFVEEGEHDVKGRRTKWQPCLMDVKSAGETKKREAESAKAKQRERTEQEHHHKLVEALKLCSDFESSRKLRELSGLNPASLATAIRSLLKRGEIEQSAIKKGGQDCDGYRLKTKVVQAVQGGTEGGTEPP